MLEVYTGTGKGKTTAALGVALRAAGHGLKTLMFSFLKDDPEYGEAKAAALLPGFELRQVGRDAFVDFRSPALEDLRLCREGWEAAKQAIRAGEADIVVLDEFDIVLATGMLPLDEAVAFLREHRQKLEIILTGRGAPDEILQIADLVTDMQEVKHYFHKGVSSRTGIDH
jgi:cob(I)alamin adenosyltransferase